MIIGILLAAFGLGGSVGLLGSLPRLTFSKGAFLVCLAALLFFLIMLAVGILLIALSVAKKNRRDEEYRVRNTRENGTMAGTCPACGLNLAAGTATCPKCGAVIRN